MIITARSLMSKRDVVSVTKNLADKNYSNVLNDLRRIGRSIKLGWDAQLSKETKKNPVSYKFSSDLRFKKFLVPQLQTYIDSTYIDNAKIDHIQNIHELKNKLTRLSRFIMVWNDRAVKDDLNSLQESAKKKLHQEIKFKASIDKDDRYAINIGLQSMVFILCQQSELIEDQDTDLKNFTTQFIQAKSKEALLEFIHSHIQKLNKLESNQYLKVTPEEPKNIQQEIEKIGAAISAFQTPNIKKKTIKYIGIIVAFLASLACGLTTGGAIYLLGPSLLALAISLGIFTVLVALTFNYRFTGIVISLVCGLAMGITVYSLGLLLTPALALLFSAITLGLLTGVFGFTANFNFFSKNFSGFLLNLVKKGGISEFIDNNGNRKQLSANYKYLLIPLITLSSLTVGVGTVALTYITILSLFTKLATILPILALVWPPLPLIIAGVLAAAVGIALTVSVLTASLDILKKVAALNLDLRSLKTRDIIGLVILLLSLPIGLAGLAYFRYAAGVDLSAFIGVIGAIVTGVVAYVAQMAFICLSVNKLKNAIINPSSSSNDFAALTVNAVGNGVLVYDGSPLSFGGMISCFLNSFCGNMSPTNLRLASRTQKTAALAKKEEKEEENANKVKTESSTAMDNLKVLPKSLNLNSCSEPKEPPSSFPIPEDGHCSASDKDNTSNSTLVGSSTFFPTKVVNNNSATESLDSKQQVATAAHH
ncbi:hypothetical protein FQR65_LT05100 [Abscondita terminalis]|nr:hypothetical protein FQR65_LT05100 [Abscondita terminalis]